MHLEYFSHDTFKKALEVDLPRADKVKLFADICRFNTLYAIKKAGSGHIGSSFSAMDIVTALYLSEIDQPEENESKYQRDIYFSSKGHDAPGLYSILTGLGLLPFEKIHHLRRLGGLPGHPDVGTNAIFCNTGSLGMGVSKAKGFLRAKNFLGKPGKIYVLTGDGELQEGQIWESLNSAVNHQLNEITVFVDHNKVQSDTLVSRVSDLGNLEDKFKSFGWHVSRVNGNNPDEILNVLEDLKKIDEKPKAVIADTIKGAGVSFMEHTKNLNDGQHYYQYHSGAPSDEDYRAAVKELREKIDSKFGKFGPWQTIEVEHRVTKNSSSAPIQNLVKKYSEIILSHACNDEKLVALDADLVLDTGLIPLSEKLPEQYIQCGIAEMDMVSQAGALALSGMLPICHSFACFLTPRANEQIYNNVTEKSKVNYSGFLAGLIPGGPGHSHQSVRDIALMGSQPNMVVIQPASEIQLEQAFNFSLQTKENVYLRISSPPFQQQIEVTGNDFREGVGFTVIDGKDGVLLTYGPSFLNEAIQAAALLRKEGKTLKLINMPWLNRVDMNWLVKELENQPFLITVDDHFLFGGLGMLIASKLCESNFQIPIKMLGIEEVPVCGTSEEVLKYHSLDADSIFRSVQTFSH